MLVLEVGLVFIFLIGYRQCGLSNSNKYVIRYNMITDLTFLFLWIL